MGRKVLVRFAVTLSVLFGTTASYDAQQQSGALKPGRIPAGFKHLDDAFWQGPWAFADLATGRPLPRWHNVKGQAPTALRLDNGTIGTLRIYAAPCLNPAECGGPRDDCGCFEDDSYWIDALDSGGTTIAHLHLWAAYGIFDVVPVDLIDGPGDEVVIVRVPAHSAPPVGNDLRVWKITPTGAVDLFRRQGDESRFTLSGYIQTVEGAIPCARWRKRLLIDRSSRKPRSIALRADFAADDWPESGCHLRKEGAEQVAALRRVRALRFKDGHYHPQGE